MIYFLNLRNLYMYSDIMMCFSKAALAVEKQTGFSLVLKLNRLGTGIRHHVPVGADGV